MKMNRILITSVVISQGYVGKPALSFNEKHTCVRFKVGEKIYDKQAQDNHRWINTSVKAFSPLVERIEKMGLKEGSYVNLSGRLDEDVWKDEKDGATKRMPVIILDDIEFCYSGGNGNNGKKPEGASEAAAPAGNGNGAGAPSAPSAGGETNVPANEKGSGQFTGYQTFVGTDDLY